MSEPVAELSGKLGVSGKVDVFSLPTVNVGRVSFACASMHEVVSGIVEAIASGRGGVVVTPNLDIVRQATFHGESMGILQRADVRTADGMAIVWASRLKGTPLPERVAGSDLTLELCRALAGRSARVALIGGDEGVAERAARRLIGRFPGLNIVGTCCPPVGFEAMPEEMAALRRRIWEWNPALVFVAMGFPKQERLIEALRAEHPDAWWIGIGITLSFISGDIKRAPVTWRRSGLEWFWRFTQEPRRLGRRYFIDGVPFGVRLLGGSLAHRLRGGLRPARRPPSAVE